MTLVGVTAASSSPGASSLALGISQAWTLKFTEQLLVDGDPSGGVLSRRFPIARDHKTLQDLAPSVSHIDLDVFKSYATQAEGVAAIVGPTGHQDACWAVEQAGAELCGRMTQFGLHGVIDLGRMSQSSPWVSSLQHLDAVVLVTRALPEEVAAAVSISRWLADRVAEQRIVLVSPSRSSRIFKRMSQRFVSKDRAWSELRFSGVAFGEHDLPYEPELAEFFCGASVDEGKFRNSNLWESIALLAEALDEPQVGAAGRAGSSPDWGSLEEDEPFGASDEAIATTQPAIRASRVSAASDADEPTPSLRDNQLTDRDAVGDRVQGTSRGERSWFRVSPEDGQRVKPVAEVPESDRGGAPEPKPVTSNDGPPPLDRPTRS